MEYKGNYLYLEPIKNEGEYALGMIFDRKPISLNEVKERYINAYFSLFIDNMVRDLYSKEWEVKTNYASAFNKYTPYMVKRLEENDFFDYEYIKGWLNYDEVMEVWYPDEDFVFDIENDLYNSFVHFLTKSHIYMWLEERLEKTYFKYQRLNGTRDKRLEKYSEGFIDYMFSTKIPSFLDLSLDLSEIVKSDKYE